MPIRRDSLTAAVCLAGLLSSGLATLTPPSAKASSLDRKIFQVETSGSPGSAFVIGPASNGRCLLITAWHVIKDNAPNEPLIFKAPSGVKFQASRSAFKSDPALDLAFMPAANCSNSLKMQLRRASAITVSSKVVIKGYPLNPDGSASNKATPSTVSGRITLYTDVEGYDLNYDAPTRPGYSGGPVMSSDGIELLAVHGLSDTVKDSQDFESREAMRVGGRGVSAPLVYKFLKSHGYTMPRSKASACLVGVC